MVGLTRDALVALHGALFREAPASAPAVLQEAGYAGGAALYEAFSGWLASRGQTAPDGVSAAAFERIAAEFFGELGWGTLRVSTLHDSALAVDAQDWAEANPASAMQYPGCYFSSGLFADFFGRLGGAPVVAMEVECRSMGHERCRFLVGSAETIQHVYDGMTQGVSYDDALMQMA